MAKEHQHCHLEEISKVLADCMTESSWTLPLETRVRMSSLPRPQHAQGRTKVQSKPAGERLGNEVCTQYVTYVYVSMSSFPGPKGMTSVSELKLS